MTEDRDAGPLDEIRDAGHGGGLLDLLDQFKAARRRRDEATFLSDAWMAADRDLEDLQRQIFDRALDDPDPPAADDELGLPEDPAAGA